MRLYGTVCLVAALCVAPVRAVDFNFKAGTELARAFETISVVGKFNVVVCPGTANVEAAYSVRNIDPVDALSMVARAHGLTVKRISRGETPTYAVGKPEQIRERFDTSVSRTIQLKYTSPKALAAILEKQVDPQAGVTISVDERTQRLLVRGPEEALAALGDLVKDVDLPLAQVRVNLTLSAGSPGKVEPVWKGSQVVEAGQDAKFDLSEVSKPGANGWRAEKLDGTFAVRVNADNFCGVRGRLDTVLGGPAGSVRAVISGQTSARSGEDVVVGSHELGGDRALTLSVRVEVVPQAISGMPPLLPGMIVGTPPPISPMPPGTGPGSPGSAPLPPFNAPPGPGPGMPPPAPTPLDDPDTDLDVNNLPAPPSASAAPSSQPSPDGKLEIDPEL